MPASRRGFRTTTPLCNTLFIVVLLSDARLSEIPGGIRTDSNGLPKTWEIALGPTNKVPLIDGQLRNVVPMLILICAIVSLLYSRGFWRLVAGGGTNARGVRDACGILRSSTLVEDELVSGAIPTRRLGDRTATAF